MRHHLARTRSSTLVAFGLLLAGLVVLLSACGSKGPDKQSAPVKQSDLKSFYLEAEIRSESNPQATPSPNQDILRSLAGPGAFRWWYEKPNKFRWEIGTDLKTVALSDGTDLIAYSPERNEYTREPAPATQPPIGPLSAILVLGPGQAQTVDDLLKTVDPGYNARKSSGGKVAGYDTEKVEITRDANLPTPTPFSISQASSNLPPSAATALARQPLFVPTPPPEAAKTEFWVEPVSAFILKERIEKTDGSVYSAEVKTLTYNNQLSPDVFKFTPPDKAVEVSNNRSNTSYSGGSWSPSSPVPQGFGVPTYVPAGLIFRQGQANTRNGQPQSFSIDYGPAVDIPTVRGTPITAALPSVREDETPAIKLAEELRRGGLAPSMQLGTPTPASFGRAYVLEASKGLVVTWSRGDVIYVLSGRGVTVEDLIRVAESIQ